MDAATPDFDPVGKQKAGSFTLPFVGEEAIRPDLLVTFDHDSFEQYIKTVSHEFSAVCPFSGLPDLATVVIEYEPKFGKAVELKSLKLYSLSYRNVGIYQERVTKRIYEDMRIALGMDNGGVYPLAVTTYYHVRGGFYTTCREGDRMKGWPRLTPPRNF